MDVVAGWSVEAGWGPWEMGLHSFFFFLTLWLGWNLGVGWGWFVSTVLVVRGLFRGSVVGFEAFFSPSPEFDAPIKPPVTQYHV